MRTAAPSLTEAAYLAIRGEVLACRLLPGEKLIISALCERLGYSLGAVREALSRLTSDGLVAAEPQRGFRVAPISAADLRDLTQTRALIEEQCLRRAVACGDDGWESRLGDAFDAMIEVPQRPSENPTRLSEDWARAHGHFHAALVQACDSPWLLRVREQLYAQSERYRRLSVPLAQSDRDLDREHRAIMDAALARDVDRAVERLCEHLAATTDIILASDIVHEARPGFDGETPRRWAEHASGAPRYQGS